MNGTTGNVSGADFTNRLVTVSIAGSKTWEDQSNKYGTRPEGITLTVLADGTPLASQPAINWTKTGDVWTYSVTGLPRYRTGTATDIDYTVVETAAAGYSPATDTTVSGAADSETGNVTGADFTNSLVDGVHRWFQDVGGPVEQVRHAAGGHCADRTGGRNTAGLSACHKLDEDRRRVDVSISGLPRYRTGTVTDIDYAVVETAAAGYSPATDNHRQRRGGQRDREREAARDFHQPPCDGVHRWFQDVGGPVEQVWHAAGGIALTVLADGTAMSPQPEISWTKTGDVWTYSISGLPRYRTGQRHRHRLYCGGKRRRRTTARRQTPPSAARRTARPGM